MTPHICHTCIHAEWKTAKDGRRNYRVPGKCTYPLPEIPPLPQCVVPPTYHRIRIWKDYGEKCVTWSDTFTFTLSQEEPEKLTLNLLREGDPLDD